MSHRKSQLKLEHQDFAINADVRTAKLSPEDLRDRPEIVRRDEQSGSLVVRQTYDKETGEPLEEGYGYRWVTEEGEAVPDEDVVEYAIEDDEEHAIEKYEPTLGSERVLTAETWIPVATIDEYLVEKVYEVWGDDETDRGQLYELAEHIRDFDEAPVVPFVLQPSSYKKWGIITPFFFEDSFSLMARVTDQKIEPEHQMAIPGETEVEEAMQSEAEGRTLEQESPFE